MLVGDGSKLWAFDQELNQVTTKKLGQALGSTPAAIPGDNSLTKFRAEGRRQTPTA